MSDPGPAFEHLLGLQGPIANMLDEYEYRPAQIKMAQQVWRSIAQERDALIEAGTGTGKSIAYLVPILLSDKNVILSTANKALQSQLYDKDVPFVQHALDLDFETVLIKGRQNYVCLRKYQVEMPQQRAFAEFDGVQAYDLDALRNWVKTTETGDIEELPFVLDSDTRAHLTCPPDECLHRDCFYYDRCFVMQVRQRAAEARVVITNHHLLISDLRLRSIGGVSLPDTDIIVCDEAHQIEDVATSIFETSVTDYTVTSLLLRKLVRQHAPANKLDKLAEQNRIFFELVRASMQEPTSRIEGDWQEGIRLGKIVRDLAETLARQNPYENDPDMEQENIHFGLAVQAIRSAGDDIITVSKSNHDDEVVRYAEQVRRKHVGLVMHATPISAAEALGKHLFGANTVICTSATLAAGGTFDLFKSRCGVPDNAIELIGDPIFDYSNQALIYLPNLQTFDWQERERYFDAVAAEIHRLLEVSRGRAFCLFTSWSGLEYVADKLRMQLPWPVLVQGDLPRSQLLQQFKEIPHCVLFGTKSFWEGVDIPGEDLSLVIIDKLPFPSPRDPLHAARSNQITEKQGNAFMEYTLPLMILSLKQGFGRLIRTKTDRGVVAILDNRLTTKRYGNLVIQSLPPARVSRRFSDVYRFFSVAPFDTEYALNVWVVAAEETASYRWQLLRLTDGRSRAGTGIAPHPQAAQWAGVDAGVRQLQQAIVKGQRQISDFQLELRLPILEGGTGPSLRTAPDDLKTRLRAFGDVHVLALESALS